MRHVTYGYDKLGKVLVLQLGVIEKLLRDSRHEGEKLELIQLLVGRHAEADGCDTYDQQEVM